MYRNVWHVFKNQHRATTPRLVTFFRNTVVLQSFHHNTSRILNSSEKTSTYLKHAQAGRLEDPELKKLVGKRIQTNSTGRFSRFRTENGPGVWLADSEQKAEARTRPIIPIIPSPSLAFLAYQTILFYPILSYPFDPVRANLFQGFCWITAFRFSFHKLSRCTVIAAAADSTFRFRFRSHPSHPINAASAWDSETKDLDSFHFVL